RLRAGLWRVRAGLGPSRLGPRASGLGPRASVHVLRLAFPVGLPDLGLEDLAGPALWERRALQDDLLRALVAGDERAAVVDEHLLVDFGALAGDDHGEDSFAPLRIGDADHRHFQDRGVLVEGILDFGRVHVFAAGNDHVFGAVDDVDEVFIVDHG